MQAGVVDEDVNRPPLRDHLGEHRLHLLLVAHVGLDGHGLPAGLGANVRADRLGRLRVGDVVDDHVRAGRRERTRAAFADPGIRARDERLLIEQWLRSFHKFTTIFGW